MRRCHGSRAAAVLVVALGLVAAVTGCSSSSAEPAADDVPVTSSAGAPDTGATPDADSTPSSTPKPEPKPLSRFEDEQLVKLAREWAAGVAQSVNDGDRQLGGIRRLTTPDGQQRMVGYGAEDAGLNYPGPMPFTPLGVRVEGDKASVPMCLWVEGFAQDRQTKQPPKPRLIAEAALWFRQVDGAWKVDDLLDADVDCSRVSVKGRGW